MSKDRCRWAIKFVGTHFMDGAYSDKSMAIEVKEHLKEKYSSLRFELIELAEDFYINDDVFWAKHRQSIDLLNNGRTSTDE